MKGYVWVKSGKYGKVKGWEKVERLWVVKGGRVKGGEKWKGYGWEKGKELRVGKRGRGRDMGEKKEKGEGLTGLWNCHARLVHRTCRTSRFSWLACRGTSKNNNFLLKYSGKIIS